MNLYKTSNHSPEIQTHRSNHLLESLLCCTIIFVDSTYPKLTLTFFFLNLPFYLVFPVSVNNSTSSSGTQARNLKVIWFLYPPYFSTCSTLVQQPGWIFQSKIISLSWLKLFKVPYNLTFRAFHVLVLLMLTWPSPTSPLPIFSASF